MTICLSLLVQKAVRSWPVWTTRRFFVLLGRKSAGSANVPGGDGGGAWVPDRMNAFMRARNHRANG